MALAEQFVLLSLGLAVIGIRIFERFRQVGGPKNWAFDDYLMPLVGVSQMLFLLPVVGHFLVTYVPTSKRHMRSCMMCGGIPLLLCNTNGAFLSAFYSKSHVGFWRAVGCL